MIYLFKERDVKSFRIMRRKGCCIKIFMVKLCQGLINLLIQSNIGHIHSTDINSGSAAVAMLNFA